jgi:hypothetical protein
VFFWTNLLKVTFGDRSDWEYKGLDVNFVSDDTCIREALRSIIVVFCLEVDEHVGVAERFSERRC